MRVRKIVSGGQTGADRGGLDAAIEVGLAHGGWCPRGRLAEDGPIPDRYAMQEIKSARYAARTERNVIDSDGTVLITRGAPTGGSALTARIAERLGRPLLQIDLLRESHDEAVAAIRRFIERREIAVLNVAGSRESRAPGLAASVRALLLDVLAAATTVE